MSADSSWAARQAGAQGGSRLLQVPGRCWRLSPQQMDGCAPLVWSRLPLELCSTNPPAPCSASADQSLWVYAEIIKIPTFKPLKLWQWKALIHLTGLCFWSGRFGGLAVPLSCCCCHHLLAPTKENEYFHAQPKCNRNPLLVVFEGVC